MSKRFFPFRLSHDNAPEASRLMNPGLSLVAAPALTDTPIEEQLAAAFNANNAVMAYVTGLMHSNIPAIQPQPDWYADFKVQFSDAKTHAMEWYNTITPGLISIPKGIYNYAFVFNINMISLNGALMELYQHPHNEQAQQAVRAGLQTLLTGFTTFLNEAGNFQELIKTFAANLTSDATKMQAAIKNAEKSVGYNKEQVDKLVKGIEALQNEVNTWEMVITGAGIGTALSVFAGAVIAIFSFGIGLAFGVMAAVAGISLMIAASVKIGQLSAQIRADQKRMSDVNKSIAALKMLEQMLQNLIKLSQPASEQVQLIIKAWQTMEADITSVITDLNSAQGDLSVLNLTGLRDELNQANTDWQALSAFCLVMMGIKYNTATPATVNLPTSTDVPSTTQVVAA